MQLRWSDSVTMPLEGINIADDFSAFSVIFKDSDGTPYPIDVVNPLHYPQWDYEIADYKVALFTHHDWPESRVIDLYYDKNRVGLLFSLQALASEETVMPSDDKWNDFGFVALQKILLGEYEYGPQELQAPLNQVAPLPITELHPKDTIVLVLHGSSCKKVMPDDLYNSPYERCLPALARYGFYPQGQEWQPCNNADAITLDKKVRKLKLKTFSLEFPSEAVAFFSDVVITVTRREQNPAFRLFIGYQVLEILMSNVYDRIIRAFADQTRVTTNTVALKDLNDKLRDKLRESSRLGFVVRNDLIGQDMLNSRDVLLLECNKLLTAIGETSAVDAPTALYKVRNYVFHSFSKVGDKGVYFENIAWSLFTLLCDLAVEYKSPDLSNIWRDSSPEGKAGA